MILTESFKCDKCGKSWNFNEIIPSVAKYGFVHLTSQNDEIIAFNCPDENCLFMVQKKLPRQGGINFYSRLDDELDPAGSGEGKFMYFSSPPFSDASYNILNSFQVSDDLEPVSEYEGCKGDIFFYNEKYYLSVNHFDFFLSGKQIRQLHYRVIDTTRLLEREGTDNIRLFPRYVRSVSLFQKVEYFFQMYFKNFHSLIYSLHQEGMNSDQVIPELFYPILYEYFDDHKFFLEQEEEVEEIKYSSRAESHIKLIEEIHPDYQKGRLHEYLTTLSHEFASDYASKFDKHNICQDSLWDFKEQYLNKLHAEWKSGSLTKINDAIPEYGFFREGNSWQIIFNGKSTGLLQGKGYEFLFYLVSHPHKEVDVTELSSNVYGIQNTYKSDFIESDIPEYTGNKLQGSNEQIDEEYKKNIRKRLRQLNEEREEATRSNDNTRIAAINRETEEITNFLRRCTGIKGKSRQFKSETQKHKDNVGKRLADAINKLEPIHEDLYNHFNNAIPNGKRRCMTINYNPPADQMVDWQFNRS